MDFVFKCKCKGNVDLETGICKKCKEKRIFGDIRYIAKHINSIKGSGIDENFSRNYSKIIS